MDLFGNILGKSESAAPFIQKAELLLDKGKMDEAVKQCRKALEIEPKNGPAWYLLGTGERALGNYTAALEAFSKCSDLLPQDPAVWIARANILAHLGRFADAVTSLERLPASDLSRRDLLLKKR